MKFLKIPLIFLIFTKMVFAQQSAVDNLASTISTPFYNVYNRNVIELLERYIIDHPEVEAIKIYDSLIDEASIIYYKDNDKPIFELDKDFPKSLSLSARAESRDILKNNQKIGVLTIYYQTLLGKELLTKKQIHYLNNKKSIKACIYPNRLPLEKIEDGKHIGMSAEIIDIIEEKLNIPIDVIITDSRQESLDYAKERACDILPLAQKSLTIKEHMSFTSEYLTAPIVIATKKDIPFISNLEEILDKRLAVLKGCPFREALKSEYPDIRLIDVESIEEGLRKVEKGDIFGYFDNSLVLNYEIQRNYIDTLTISGKIDEECEFRIATRNDEPQLNDIFQKAISSIPESRKDEIYKKWISTKIEKIKVVDYSLVYRIAILSLSIIIVFIYWNRKIAKANQALEEAKKEIEKLATVDKLTNLFNRMKLDSLLEAEIKRCKRYNSSLAVCILDIDHFKSVNDTYGHLVGDNVLVEVADLGSANIRSTDYFGRWGGEEFLIIMPETDEKGGFVMIENLRKKIEACSFSNVGSMTASFGMSSFKEGDAPETIIKRADDALYEAKKSGRNSVVLKS